MEWHACHDLLYNEGPVSYISNVVVKLWLQQNGQTRVFVVYSEILKGQFNNVSVVVIIDSEHPKMRQLKKFGD